MMREALAKLDRQANERGVSSTAGRADWSFATFLSTISSLRRGRLERIMKQLFGRAAEI